MTAKNDAQGYIPAVKLIPTLKSSTRALMAAKKGKTSTSRKNLVMGEGSTVERSNVRGEGMIGNERRRNSGWVVKRTVVSFTV